MSVLETPFVEPCNVGMQAVCVLLLRQQIVASGESEIKSDSVL